MARFRHPDPPPCDQQCGAVATCYAIDPLPGGWGGHYCDDCAAKLRFQIIDIYTNEEDE